MVKASGVEFSNFCDGGRWIMIFGCIENDTGNGTGKKKIK